MNCQQAKEQIDERILAAREGLLVRESHLAPQADDAELDAHLASCAACCEHARSVAATDKLLAGVRSDRPTNEEIQSMWNRLALSLPGGGAVTVTPKRKPRPILRLALYTATVAAVFLVAAQLGSLQYGGNVWIPGLPSLSRARMSSQSMSYERERDGILRDVNSDVLSATDSNGWAIPVHSGKNSDQVASTQRLLRMTAPGASPALARRPAPGDGRTDGERPSDAALDASAHAARSAAPQTLAPPPAPNAELVGLSYGYQQPFGKENSPRSGSDAPKHWTRFDKNDSIPAKKLAGLGYVSADSKATSTEQERLMILQAAQQNMQMHAIRQTTLAQVQSGGQSTFGGGSAGSGSYALHNDAASDSDSSSGSSEDLEEEEINIAYDDSTGRLVLENPVSGDAEGVTDQASNVPSSAKIIRTGKLIVEVPSYADSAAQVEQIVARHRGFIGDSNVVELTGGAITGTLVIRVPAEQFEGLFAALKALGRIVSEHSDAADVTAAYVDLEARILSHRVTEERLHDLVRNKTIVDKVSSLLEVERELQRVRSEIEQMQGELRVMGDRVALSTITLALSEPKRIVPSAGLSVEVRTVEEAGATLGTTLEAIDGRQISGKTSKRSDGSLTATYQLQAPLSRFGELLAAIQGMGRIEERQVSDREFTQINEPWAAKVQCNIALTVFERSRQLPSGTMFVQAENLDSALVQLESVLEPASARIVSNYTMVDPQGTSKAEVSLSVPAARFAALVDQLAKLGRVSSQTVTGETQNIAGGAASVLCNLRLTVTEIVREVPSGQIAVEVDKFDTARTAISTLVSEKKLQVLDSSSQQNHDGSWTAGFELGVEAKDMEAVVGRLESLGRVVSRNMQGIGLGSLSRTDPNALGHLGVHITEKSAIAPAPQQASQTVRSHLREGLEGLYKSVGLIAYGLIVMGPWLAIAILLGWLVSRVRSRRAFSTPSASPKP